MDYLGGSKLMTGALKSREPFPAGIREVQKKKEVG